MNARDLWLKNQADILLPLSKLQKVRLGFYLVIRDWLAGNFPPSFLQQNTWDNEIEYVNNCPGYSAAEVYRMRQASPFVFDGDDLRRYLRDLVRIRDMMKRLGIRPPARVAELGCSQGWLSELLAMMGFAVIGTTISPGDVEQANKRVQALEQRGIESPLSFCCCPMERVHEHISAMDCIIVYEALHHAFDWRAAIRAAASALRPGGWFLICHEPNIAHTFISYRVAKLTNTHEIGISRRALNRELVTCGFTPKWFSSRLHFGVRWHWLAAKLTSR